MDISEKKGLARQEFLAKRQSLACEAVKEKSARLCAEIFEFTVKMNADAVLLFYPIKKEPDLRELVKKLTSCGISVGFPITRKDIVSLDFREVYDVSEMSRGAYGICEPSENMPRINITERSLCVVPALAFDRCGARLGYGKGYYDRFLSEFCGKSAGAIFSDFLVEQLPTDKFDVCVNTIITEGGVILPDETNQKACHPQGKTSER